MTHPLEALGYTPEEIQAMTEKEPDRPKSYQADHRVCYCGHPARAHSSEGTTESAIYRREHNLPEECKMAKMVCPCAKFEPVLTTTKIRVFTFKTTGTAEGHALQKGITAALKKDGGEVTWLDQPVCRVCGVNDGRLTIAAVRATPSGLQTSETWQPGNGFLCVQHLTEFGGNK